MNKCNCYSYNMVIGKTPEVGLIAPSWSHKSLNDHPANLIMVDACIAETIKELWNRGIETLSSCCGHNIYEPSVVVSLAQRPDCYKILKEIDERKPNWFVLSWDWIGSEWILTEHNNPNKKVNYGPNKK